MRFRTTILSAGKTAAGIEVPPEAVEALGSGRKPPVKVTINGYTYRSSVATVSGAFMIGVSNDVRRAAGVAAGEDVDVELQLDTEPRVVQVPGDLAEALDADEAARTAFDRLTYSNKRRIVMLVEDAKKPETRQRRIDKSIADLIAGRA
jgi:Bacteriocin-protection, YdeI or OmpD-Associated/Domain of unknown function (DUF1905)